MLGKFLKRESYELQSSSGNVAVGANGCGAFVLTSGTTIFDGGAGELAEEMQDGRLFNTQFHGNLSLGGSRAPHAEGNVDLAFCELLVGRVWIYSQGGRGAFIPPARSTKLFKSKLIGTFHVPVFVGLIREII